MTRREVIVNGLVPTPQGDATAGLLTVLEISTELSSPKEVLTWLYRKQKAIHAITGAPMPAYGHLIR